jgi:hypothetical protein
MTREHLCFWTIIVVFVFNVWVFVFLWATGLLDSQRVISRAEAAWKMYREAQTRDEKVVAIGLGVVIVTTSGARLLYGLAVVLSGWGISYTCRSNQSSP